MMKLLRLRKKMLAMVGAIAILTGSTVSYASAQESAEIKTSAVLSQTESEKLVLTKEQKEGLCQDFLQKCIADHPEYQESYSECDIEDIVIEKYCGTYKEGEVGIFIDPMMYGTTAIEKMQIGSYEFTFSGSVAALSFYLHKDHQFIPVKDAYEAQLISDEELEEIHNIFHSCYAAQFTQPFQDVTVTDWFYPYVYSDRIHVGIMNGLDAHTFGPAMPLARAQFAVILHRMDGKMKVEIPEKDLWNDVDQNWFKEAVYWANEKQIMMGYTNSDLWGSCDNITREQLATALYRYATYKNYDTTKRANLDNFADADTVSGFATEAMQWAVAEGIITGKDHGTKLDPQGAAMRAECAAMMDRFIEKN